MMKRVNKISPDAQLPDTQLKVIGAGFGRTGTNSLKLALEQLGYDPCHHMIEVFKHMEQIPLWLDVATGQLQDWELIFAPYKAMVDFPGSVYYRELMTRYPEAKVLLSVRDPERWYDSTLETIYQISSVVPKRFWPFIPRLGKFYQMVDRVVWQGLFAGRFTDRQHAIAVFNAWNREVKSVVPAARLLVFDVQEGWEPLCAFLGVEVPATPFPHVNDRKTMMQRIRVMKVVTRVLPVLLGMLLFGAFYLVFR